MVRAGQARRSLAEELWVGVTGTRVQNARSCGKSSSPSGDSIYVAVATSLGYLSVHTTSSRDADGRYGGRITMCASQPLPIDLVVNLQMYAQFAQIEANSVEILSALDGFYVQHRPLHSPLKRRISRAPVSLNPRTKPDYVFRSWRTATPGDDSSCAQALASDIEVTGGNQDLHTLHEQFAGGTSCQNRPLRRSFPHLPRLSAANLDVW
jgi:hypothetical protein